MIYEDKPDQTPRGADRDIYYQRSLGVWTGADIRQPPGVASLKEYAIVGRDDTRRGDETTQTQDIFTRVAQFEALGAGSQSDAARYALGAMLGLASVGLVLLVLSFVTRRRSGAGTDPAVEEKAAAKVK